MNKISSIPWQEYKTAVFANINNKADNLDEYAVISVWNKLGEKLTKRENQKMALKVIQYLNRRGLKYQRVWAGSPDMAYRELSLLIRADNFKANKIAFFAKQNAYHIVRNGSVLLIPTNKIRQPFKLSKLKHHQIKFAPRVLKYGTNQAVAP